MKHAVKYLSLLAVLAALLLVATPNQAKADVGISIGGGGGYHHHHHHHHHYHHHH